MPIYLHRKEISRVFDLLGDAENDMTYSLGWCLAQAPQFLEKFTSLIGIKSISEHPILRLQAWEPDSGITDLEIYSPGSAMAVVEAKRGFVVPDHGQLSKYVRRLVSHEDKGATKHLVVLTQYAAKYVTSALGSKYENQGCRYLLFRGKTWFGPPSTAWQIHPTPRSVCLKSLLVTWGVCPICRIRLRI